MKMFIDVLVQVVNIARENVYQTDLFIYIYTNPISGKK